MQRRSGLLAAVWGFFFGIACTAILQAAGPLVGALGLVLGWNDALRSGTRRHFSLLPMFQRTPRTSIGSLVGLLFAEAAFIWYMHLPWWLFGYGVAMGLAVVLFQYLPAPSGDSGNRPEVPRTALLHGQRPF